MGPIPPLSDPVAVLDRASVSVVRERIRAGAELVGLETHETERLVLATSDLAQNQLDDAARWRAEDALVELLGVGNVAAWVIGPMGEQRYRPTPGVLGARWPAHRPTKRLELAPGRMLVLATDGISSRATVERRLVAKGPIAAAQHLLDEHGKDHDDALVAVPG